jgi:hypothetical protein
MDERCEHYPPCPNPGTHFAYGYGFAGHWCAEHCPNRAGQEGCDHWDEHPRDGHEEACPHAHD